MEMDGQELTMRSMFTEPQSTQHFALTYGGFMLHCGLLSMESPGPEGRHPVHGELPNAPYRQAFVRAGTDGQGAYLELGGTFEHTIAFGNHYRAKPVIRLYEGATTVRICMDIENLSSRTMEYTYLAHINFRPVDYGRLIYSAPCNSDHVEIYRNDAEETRNPELAAFMERLAHNPKILDVLEPSHKLNPGMMASYLYLADDEGWAHSLHVQPDGYAGYVKHRPQQLDKVVRWIARTGDEDALGLALPATATALGIAAEKRRGNVKSLASRHRFAFEIETGLLSPERAAEIEAKIASILAQPR